MIYLYAYTNHRANLDALRRMGALWHQLKAQGVEAELIVNDYRAQLAGRELGLPLATTIDNIMEIDGVVNFADTLVIDSPEPIGERLDFYVQKYAKVYMVKECNVKSRFGEEILALYTQGALVDSMYQEAPSSKNSNLVLIYGDSDYDKRLLNASKELKDFDLELYWGSYFYVKYEDELAKYFKKIYESDSYKDLIKESEVVVTTMVQTALEAFMAGAKTIWLDSKDDLDCTSRFLESIGVIRLSWGDWEALEIALDTKKVDSGMIDNFAKKWAEIISKT